MIEAERAAGRAPGGVPATTLATVLLELNDRMLERVALGGPLVKRPRLLRTRVGVDLLSLVEGELTEGLEARIVSGSLLSGRATSAHLTCLGRWHSQISVVREGREREFLGWQAPGAD